MTIHGALSAADADQVVDGDDHRVLDLGERDRLPLDPFPPGRGVLVAERPRGQLLDRHGPLEVVSKASQTVPIVPPPSRRSSR